MKNPPGIECDNVLRSFGDDLVQNAYKEELQWQKIDPSSSNFNDIVSRQGALTCFCDAAKRAEPEELYDIITENKTIESYPICKKFAKDTSSFGFFGALTQIAAFMVVVTGFILRTVFIKLILFTKPNKNSVIAS